MFDRRFFLRLAFLLLCMACFTQASPTNDIAVKAAETHPPLFRFGIVTDIQYGDKANVGKRSYRDSLERFKLSIEVLNRSSLEFVAHLGDIIDGNETNSVRDLDRVLEVAKGLKPPLRHVLGNHCLSVEKSLLLQRLGLNSSYYSFVTKDWRFVVLDTMEVSVKSVPGSPAEAEAKKLLEAFPKLVIYNGGISKAQLEWLKSELTQAKDARQQVIILAHHSLWLGPESSGNVLWNAAPVKKVVEESGCVKAWFCGHEHQGDYVRHSGIDFVTFKGMVDSTIQKTDFAIVEIYPDHIQINGMGSQPSMRLDLQTP